MMKQHKLAPILPIPIFPSPGVKCMNNAPQPRISGLNGKIYNWDGILWAASKEGGATGVINSGRISWSMFAFSVTHWLR